MSGPKIIGLTGSIGMGKSTVASMFADEGVPVFDADAEVRVLQAKGGALLPAIEAAFPGMTDSEGVKRDILGQLVFGDHAALARLEALIHPAIAEKRAMFLHTHRASDLVVFDIPLLFEKGGFELVDKVIVVSAPFTIQRARVLARPGMTLEKFTHICALQVPDEEKRARADYVIDTGQSLDHTSDQLRVILDELRQNGSAAA